MLCALRNPNISSSDWQRSANHVTLVTMLTVTAFKIFFSKQMDENSEEFFPTLPKRKP